MKTNFEKVTASPKDLAFFIACNVKCDDCIISAFCKKNIIEDDDCQDIWLKWLILRGDKCDT